MDKIDNALAARRNEAWQLLKITGHEWWRHDTFRFAASLAFYTMFSLAPVLLIVVGVASLFLARETAIDKIVVEVQRLVGQQGAQAVRQVLEASSGFGKSMWAIATGVITFSSRCHSCFRRVANGLEQNMERSSRSQARCNSKTSARSSALLYHCAWSRISLAGFFFESAMSDANRCNIPCTFTKSARAKIIAALI
jgi:Virulence factor BrkB